MAQAAAADVPADKKGKKKNKKKMKRNIALGVLAFLSFIIWFGFQPLMGPIQVGICRTFAEMHMRYPTTMKLTMMDQYQDILRLYYTYYGPFGEHRSSLIECRSTTDPATGQIVFTSIKIDKVPVGETELKVFNQTIPTIISHKPNLIIPSPYTGDLYDLKRD